MTLTPELLRQTLTTVLSLAKQEGGFDYRLIGTAADLLRGVPIEPCDVDFLMPTRSDVDTFARALAAYRCLSPPTWMPCCVQYYAAFEVGGVQVDASTVGLRRSLLSSRPSAAAPGRTFPRSPWATRAWRWWRPNCGWRLNSAVIERIAPK